MDKNHVFIGMLVHYEDYDESFDALVIEKDLHTCRLLDVNTYDTYDACEYQRLSQRSEASAHNRNMRRLGGSNHPHQKFQRNTNQTFVFNDGTKVWFTSDTHFHHDNILKFCNRPFQDVKEMNECMIETWNELIGPEDTVFHLGDFCFGGSSNWLDILPRLNGHIHLILGNHDVKNIRVQYLDYFESVSFQQQIIVEGRSIYLNHYPFLTWGGMYRDADHQVWQLFGHVHSKNGSGGADSGRLQYLLPIQYDVGVDNNIYEPLNFKEVEKIILQQIKDSQIEDEDK